jgi:hypothetical protein
LLEGPLLKSYSTVPAKLGMVTQIRWKHLNEMDEGGGKPEEETVTSWSSKDDLRN